MPLNWNTYEKNFRKAASDLRLTPKQLEAYEDSCLTYAKRLYDNNLPVIYDGLHLCKCLLYRVSFVYAVANSPYKFYRHFKIPKKSGGERLISEPLPSLKEIQRWILDNILVQIKPSRFAKAFQRNRDITDNARFHVGQPYVLSVDIENFFPSINFKRVFSVFFRCGYSVSVSTLLSKLCTLDNALPQGAPTSPALSNLIASRLDRRISGFTIKNRLRYTRYADDITISGLQNAESIGSIFGTLYSIIESEGFKVKTSKTRVMHQGQQQKVTGIVVNSKMSSPRTERRSLRQVSYYIRKHGLASHMDRTRQNRSSYVEHLMGRAGFVLFLDPKNKDALQLTQMLAPKDRAG